MPNIEKIEDFYRNKFGWLPDDIKKEIGHFNVLNLELFAGKNARPVPFRKRDFYKITLVCGNAEVHYADKTVEIKERAIVFTNPQIPYKWEGTEKIKGGRFCIFNQEFLSQVGNLSEYSIFKSGGPHIFELDEAQYQAANKILVRMEEELNSNYIHKYDLLRTLVQELMHFAMKMQPSTLYEKLNLNASHRISTLFTELLERQFPIENTHQGMGLRSASDFAKQLNVHVNYLNRSVKEVTGKTTSTIIGERILQEAKVLLRHSDLPVSEVAYSLGFQEPTHFNNFFKKHMNQSPSQYRKR